MLRLYTYSLSQLSLRQNSVVSQNTKFPSILTRAIDITKNIQTNVLYPIIRKPISALLLSNVADKFRHNWSTSYDPFYWQRLGVSAIKLIDSCKYVPRIFTPKLKRVARVVFFNIPLTFNNYTVKAYNHSVNYFRLPLPKLMNLTERYERVYLTQATPRELDLKLPANSLPLSESIRPLLYCEKYTRNSVDLSWKKREKIFTPEKRLEDLLEKVKQKSLLVITPDTSIDEQVDILYYKQHEAPLDEKYIERLKRRIEENRILEKKKYLRLNKSESEIILRNMQFLSYEQDENIHKENHVSKYSPLAHQTLLFKYPCEKEERRLKKRIKDGLIRDLQIKKNNALSDTNLSNDLKSLSSGEEMLRLVGNNLSDNLQNINDEHSVVSKFLPTGNNEVTPPSDNNNNILTLTDTPIVKMSQNNDKSVKKGMSLYSRTSTAGRHHSLSTSYNSRNLGQHRQDDEQPQEECQFESRGWLKFLKRKV